MTGLKKRLQTNCFQNSYVIAEVGQAHEGSLGQAMALAKMAAELGADAIKYQMHFSEEESSVEDSFREGTWFPQDKSRTDYWKRIGFSVKEWEQLHSYTLDLGVDFIASPFSIKAVQVLHELGVDVFKIASGEFFNLPMLDEICKHDAGLLVSTGMSSWEEIVNLNNYLVEMPLAFLHCVSAYPVLAESLGLNEIPKFFEQVPNRTIGYSDHSGSFYSCLAARAKGAVLFEVHVTFSQYCFGPDTSSSLTPENFKLLRDGLRAFDLIEGSAMNKDDFASQNKEMRMLFGRGIYAAVDMKRGDVITADKCAFLKPLSPSGVSASKYKDIVGCNLKNDIKAGSPLSWGEVE